MIGFIVRHLMGLFRRCRFRETLRPRAGNDEAQGMRICRTLALGA